jgi:hypothetical protein
MLSSWLMWVRRDGGGWGDPVVNAVAVIGGAAVAAVASSAGWDRRLRVIGALRRELPDRLLIVN